jgi:4-amino-4-deoxy-L-arabinose transferase-like glycosyltransferase
LAVFYSFVTAVTLLKIVRLFGFTEKTNLLLAVFLVLFPRHIQFAGMLNNDAISYMLATLALYYALKWWKGAKSPVHILLCSLSVGLGMMAKLSSATVCVPIAGIFIYEFIRTLLKKDDALKLWQMVLQYGAFLCICAPIGLWFQLYASIRFDQPLGFVFSNLNKKLYTGHHSLWGRFGITLDISEYLASLYCRPFEGNYNLFNYALKSSIFGEFTYNQGDAWGAVSVLFAYMGIAFLIFGGIWAVVLWWKSRKGEDGVFRQNSPVCHKDVLFTALLIASQVLSEIYFYVKMPYGCTMDFRYIMPLIFGFALGIGLVRKVLLSAGGVRAESFTIVLDILVGGFILSSVLFYTVCG